MSQEFFFLGWLGNLRKREIRLFSLQDPFHGEGFFLCSLCLKQEETPVMIKFKRGREKNKKQSPPPFKRKKKRNKMSLSTKQFMGVVLEGTLVFYSKQGVSGYGEVLKVTRRRGKYGGTTVSVAPFLEDMTLDHENLVTISTEGGPAFKALTDTTLRLATFSEVTSAGNGDTEDFNQPHLLEPVILGDESLPTNNH